MTIISGILKDRQGTVLAQASLTLTETDSKQTVITTTDNTGHYYIQLSPGTWRVTLGRGDAPPKDAGVIAITKDTAPGALDDYIASLQPSTLDIQVLGFMRGLVDEAERASEATSQAKQFADAARQGAQQAEQALKAAQEIAKTPGPKGDKGDPGPQGIPGRGGYQGKDGKSAYDVWALQQPAGSDTSVTAFMAYLKAIPGPKGDKGAPGKDGVPGKSAWEIWVTQQPAGSDTSMAAYMEYMKGKTGGDGDVKKTDIPAYLVKEALQYGDDLNGLKGNGKEGIYPFYVDYLDNAPPSRPDGGGSVQVRKLNNNVYVQEMVTAQGEIWRRIFNVSQFTDWTAVIRNRPDDTEANSWDYPGSYGLFLITAGVDLTSSGASPDAPDITVIYPQIVEGMYLRPAGFSCDRSSRTPELILLDYTMSGIWEIHGYFVTDHSGDSIVLALRTR
ncbi:prophage tail fiber N-terminal domain-containing protein [Salmonella enterica]|nr:prophage tail fiber N-terminal domain-containing protein [Salmonella enterica]